MISEPGYSMFSGCSTCPVKDCTTDFYRGSACSALRYAAGINDDPLTQAEALRKKEDMELRNFLYSISKGKRPWCKPENGHTCIESESACKICLNGWLSSKYSGEQKEEDENGEQ